MAVLLMKASRVSFIKVQEGKSFKLYFVYQTCQEFS